VSTLPPVSDQASAVPPSDYASRWFTQEVHPHGVHLKAFLRGSFPSVCDVDDVVQESYLRIWKARAAQPIHSAKALLFTIARHIALDLLRRDRISPVDRFHVMDSAASHVIDNRPGVVETACAREEIVLLAKAIDALPTRCREIIILRKLNSVPQKEIAARLGIAEPTVQVQIARGMKKCDQYLREHGVRFAWP
jgi:RNA polymerase sigma-70 factor (ECF subfamily)